MVSGCSLPSVRLLIEAAVWPVRKPAFVSLEQSFVDALTAFSAYHYRYRAAGFASLIGLGFKHVQIFRSVFQVGRSMGVINDTPEHARG